MRQFIGIIMAMGIIGIPLGIGMAGMDEFIMGIAGVIRISAEG
jgi:hypothetical protein